MHAMPNLVPPLEYFEEGSPQTATACVSIWLLDDDNSMLKALGRLLKSAGFSVEKFDEPAAFLAKAKEGECRVAVLDVWMPEINGLEVQASLGQSSPGTHIIFISGRDDPSVRQAALDAGAFGFLSKPFKDEELIQLIEKALASAGTTSLPIG
jgi:FixJ family two-component response regulator